MLIRRLLTYSLLSLIALGGFFGNLQIDIGTQTENHIKIAYVGNGVYAAEPCDSRPDLDQCKGKNGATDPSKPDKEQAKSQVEKWNGVIDTLNMALAVLSALISPIILFVGWLMSPDWTSGDLFGLRSPMYSLWVTVSNIVYFVYAVMLILIALGTMFGNDKFSYKVMLPKLALGILMVPFTWWFVQWTISISAVVTASVMTIPQETIGIGNTSKWFNDKTIPKNIYFSSLTGSTNTPTDCSSTNSDCISPKDFLSKSSGMYGPLVVYGYSVFKFENITRLDGPADVASALIKVVHTSIISTIMFFVFGLLVLALATILIMRAVKLWAYAIFAPLFTFQFVAGSVGSDKDMFSIKEFIGLCFVPAVVGLSLSFGLIMIAAVSSTNTSSEDTKPCELSSSLNPKGCVLMNIMGSPDNSITRHIRDSEADTGGGPSFTETVFKYGEMNFMFIGKSENQTSTKTTAHGAIDALGGMFGRLIIDIIALVFIWLAFMAAKNVSKAVAGAIEPFEKIGSQVGNLAKSLPKYTPLPIPGGSISGAAKAVDLAQSSISSASDKRFADSGIGKMLSADKYVSKDRDEKLTQAIKDGNKAVFERDIKEMGNREYAYKSGFVKAFMEELKGKDSATQETYLRKMGINDSNQQKSLKDFANDSSKNELKIESHQKEFLSKIVGAVGSNTNPGGTSGTFTKTGVAGSESININIGGITKASIDVKTATVSNITDEVKKHLKENITEDDLRAGLNGISLSDQEKIVKAMKDYLKPKK